MPVCICKKENMMKYATRCMHIYNFPFVVHIGGEVWRWCIVLISFKGDRFYKNQPK